MIFIKKKEKKENIKRKQKRILWEQKETVNTSVTKDKVLIVFLFHTFCVHRERTAYSRTYWR